MRRFYKKKNNNYIGYIILAPLILMYYCIYAIIKLLQTFTNKKKNKYNNKYINGNEVAKNKNIIEQQKYDAKNIMTECEKRMYNMLKNVISERYIVQPQIPLSAIIKKENDYGNNYAGELYRTIDYGIFDKEYNLICCIELNDLTHLQHERQQRDNKVKEILKQANITLITFWTNEELNENMIYQRLKGCIKFNGNN